MTIKHLTRRLARKLGLEVNRYDPLQSLGARYAAQLVRHGIDTILDVGANDGGYGSFLREIGFAGTIVSFEPSSAAHRALAARAADDAKWFVMPAMALGSDNGQAELNISANSASSSILAMHAVHARAAPGSRYVGREMVQLKRLADISHDAIRRANSLMLKIDTQGFELPVLKGAGELLARVKGVHVELSLVELYAGQDSYLDVTGWLLDRDFQLWNVIPGFVDAKSGRLLQFDGVFFRGPSS